MANYLVDLSRDPFFDLKLKKHKIILSLSLLLASVTPNITHNQLVKFQSRSRDKWGIRLCS